MTEKRVTVTPADVEAALRGWLTLFDYDLHKATERGEGDGQDHYPEEAAALFERLVAATTAQGPEGPDATPGEPVR